MNNYEMMYICDPSNEEGIEDIKKRIEGIITGREGQVISYEKLGKKRLAYPIQKRLYGLYYLVLFQGDGRIVQALDYFLRLNPITIRHLILIMSEKQIRLRDLTEKIQGEEAERMRRGGRPLGSSESSETENDQEQTSKEIAPDKITEESKIESDTQKNNEVISAAEPIAAEPITDKADIEDSVKETSADANQSDTKINDTTGGTEPQSDEVEKLNEKTVE
ncbi:30S ribosomal protein S6 [bacterium]|nr:30S ribosomal protein S6 [bacterium]